MNIDDIRVQAIEEKTTEKIVVQHCVEPYDSYICIARMIFTYDKRSTQQ